MGNNNWESFRRAEICTLFVVMVGRIVGIFFALCSSIHVWARVEMLWDLNFVGDGDVDSTFDLWFHVHPMGSKILI